MTRRQLRAVLLLSACVSLGAASKGLGLFSEPVSAIKTGHDRQRAAVVNLTASFHPGPFSALYVDPNDPSRIAVGTEDGHVLWSENSGASVKSARALETRRYDPVAIRAGSRQIFSRPDREADSKYNPEQEQRKTDGPRSILLFLRNLEAGDKHARWQAWMALGDPWTMVTSIAMPNGKGPMAIASPAGVIVSDRGRRTWGRMLGGPGQMPKERDLFPLAVAINPANPKHILASTDQGLMISRDAGNSFHTHKDTALLDVFISKFIWSAEMPNEVYAIAGETILASEDYGETFEPTFSAAAEVTDMALAADSGFVGTHKGVHILSPNGLVRALEDKQILAVTAWQDGTALAITEFELFMVFPNGRAERLLHTVEKDKYLGLAGNSEQAWLVSRHGILRIGPQVERAKSARYRPPRLLMSQEEVERAVLKYTGIGDPIDTRLHDRWYAKLVPELRVDVEGKINRDDSRLREPFPDIPPEGDGTRWSERFNQNSARSLGDTEYVVWAHWDLSKFVFGDSNVVNPKLVIESQIREKRKQVIEEVRWHYREAAGLINQLKNPPKDPETELLWRWRLDEMVSYLEYMSGEKLLENNDLENLK